MGVLKPKLSGVHTSWLLVAPGCHFSSLGAIYRIPRGFPTGGGIIFFSEIVPPGGKTTRPGGIYFFFTYPGGKAPCECFQAEKVVMVGEGNPRGIRYLACALLLCSGFPTFFFLDCLCGDQKMKMTK